MRSKGRRVRPMSPSLSRGDDRVILGTAYWPSNPTFFAMRAAIPEADPCMTEVTEIAIRLPCEERL